MNTSKMDFYDSFKCIADQCSFSCCRGWDIIVDADTLQRWRKEEHSNYFFKNIRRTGSSKVSECNIKMSPLMSCPFLDEKGLCNIVIQHGDDYLPKTCREFPRQENSFGEITEYSLSCACPAVVDIIANLSGSMKFRYEGETYFIDQLTFGYRLRGAMLNLMQNSKYKLKNRLLFMFHLLLLVQEEPEQLLTIVKQYTDDKHLQSLLLDWNVIGINSEASCEETNELFLDITENYSEEENYYRYLETISELAEDLDVESCLVHWENFKLVFDQYEQLMENVLVSKIYANCVNDTIDEMIMSFQLVITEYIMVRHSVFLKWLLDNNVTQRNRMFVIQNKPEYNDIRDYIVIYSRIIGYNADGIREFWEDSFDEATWEIGYMMLLIG